MIFDSSAIEELLKQEDFAETHAISGRICVTSITVYELLRGAIYIKYARNSEKELHTLLNLFSELHIFPFDEKSAKVASYIHARLKEAGTMVNDADVLIAAICIQADEKLLTKDSHFTTVQEVYPAFTVELL